MFSLPPPKKVPDDLKGTSGECPASAWNGSNRPLCLGCDAVVIIVPKEAYVNGGVLCAVPQHGQRTLGNVLAGPGFSAPSF